MVREYLTEMSVALGFSGCEIFPKQDTILAERGDVGNFINMPYFGGDVTTRYALDEKGEAMDMAQFFAAVDAASGFVYDEPLDVALATIGIARPLKFVRQTMSDEAEAALSYAFGAGGLYMELENFLTSLGEKSSEK